MKFIHTADIHLDSPLKGLSAYPDAPAERLRTATREAFQNLISVAIAEQVDFMVIAGDVYDGNWRDFNTGLYFVAQMGRLRRAGIPVYLLYGNHDAESEMTRGLVLPDNVHVFKSDKARTFLIEDKKVALHGRSFKVAATTENLVPGYPDPVEGFLNIGILHTGLEGKSEHAHYAPCSVGELKAKGYHYWALGHVHEHRLVERGDVTIAFPGNLQGRHIRETGPRGALLVTADDMEIKDVERLHVDVLRWESLEVDISDVEDRQGSIRAVGNCLAELLTSTPDHLTLAVRVQITGTSIAHAELIADEAQLRQEVIAQAITLDSERLWVEKVRVSSKALDAAGPQIVDEQHGALAELTTLAATAADDPDFVNAVRKDWDELFEKMPLDVLQASAELQAFKSNPATQLQEWLPEVASLAMGRVLEKLITAQRGREN